MPAGGGTTRGRAKVLARTPARAPQPAPRHYQGPPPTSYHAAQQAQRRAVPKPQRTVRRVTTGKPVNIAQQQAQESGQQARRALLAALVSKHWEDGSVSHYLLTPGITKDFRNLIAGSPVGAGLGNVVANQTWAKLAPLFQRKASEQPAFNVGKVPRGTAGFESGGQVTVSPDQISGLLAGGDKALKGILAHEFAHTQQAPQTDWTPSTSRARKGGLYSPRLEGGADAFKAVVAPLLGYNAQPPSPKTDYGRAQIRYFTQGKGDAMDNNIRKTLLAQFPRVRRRLTP